MITMRMKDGSPLVRISFSNHQQERKINLKWNSWQILSLLPLFLLEQGNQLLPGEKLLSCLELWWMENQCRHCLLKRLHHNNQRYLLLVQCLCAWSLTFAFWPLLGLNVCVWEIGSSSLGPFSCSASSNVVFCQCAMYFETNSPQQPAVVVTCSVFMLLTFDLCFLSLDGVKCVCEIGSSFLGPFSCSASSSYICYPNLLELAMSDRSLSVRNIFWNESTTTTKGIF